VSIRMQEVGEQVMRAPAGLAADALHTDAKTCRPVRACRS
jgi:hypothetical protein